MLNVVKIFSTGYKGEGKQIFQKSMNIALFIM